MGYLHELYIKAKFLAEQIFLNFKLVQHSNIVIGSQLKVTKSTNIIFTTTKNGTPCTDRLLNLLTHSFEKRDNVGIFPSWPMAEFTQYALHQNVLLNQVCWKLSRCRTRSTTCWSRNQLIFGFASDLSNPNQITTNTETAMLSRTWICFWFVKLNLNHYKYWDDNAVQVQDEKHNMLVSQLNVQALAAEVILSLIIILIIFLIVILIILMMIVPLMMMIKHIISQLNEHCTKALTALTT